MSRHAKIADDSTRFSIVFPKYVREDLAKVAVKRLVTISDIIREYVMVGMSKDKERFNVE